MSHALPSLSVLGLALAAACAAAQPADTDVATPAMTQCAIDSLKPSPPFRAAARQDVADAINRVNTCVGKKDAACGETAVASVQTLTLSDDERGLLAYHARRAGDASRGQRHACATENVRVLRSTNEVSVAAVQQWRYAPNFENGVPVGYTGQQTVLVFCREPCNPRRNPPPERGPDGKYVLP